MQGNSECTGTLGSGVLSAMGLQTWGLLQQVDYCPEQ